MKRFFLFLALSVSAISFAQNQINATINAGLTTGDLRDISSASFSADVNYLFYLNDNFNMGPSLGVTYFKAENKDISYMPIAAALRVQKMDDPFYIGVDFGYGIALSSDVKGGVYLKPILGYDISSQVKINAFYSVIKQRYAAHSFAGLGLTFNLNSNSYYSGY